MRQVFYKKGIRIMLFLFICISGLLSSCSSKNEDKLNPGGTGENEPDELTDEDLIDYDQPADFDYGATNGKIRFSGFDWDVKSSVTRAIGPGPNYFSMSDKNVWIDKSGSLHLKISERNDTWYVSSVSLQKTQGYGKYIVYLSSKTELLDPNIVVGLFLYKADDREIDIELSKWGDAQNLNSQFVIQPGDRNGNKSRFDVTTEGYKTTHFIDWQKDSIRFGSYKGITLNPKKENIFSEWVYKGKDNPEDDGEKFIINFWLFRGNAPLNKEDAELVIDSVRIIKH